MNIIVDRKFINLILAYINTYKMIRSKYCRLLITVDRTHAVKLNCIFYHTSHVYKYVGYYKSFVDNAILKVIVD